MSDDKRMRGDVVGLPEGARRATGGRSTTGAGDAPSKPIQRWSLQRKRDVVLRMLRGESVQVLSREVGVEVYRLEEWRAKALEGMEMSLRERAGDPIQQAFDSAMKRLGEVTMENELLKARIEKQHPFGKRRSRK